MRLGCETVRGRPFAPVDVRGREAGLEAGQRPFEPAVRKLRREVLQGEAQRAAHRGALSRTVDGHVEQLVDEAHRADVTGLDIASRAGAARRDQLLREPACGGRVGRDRVPARREQGGIKGVAVARGAGDSELHRGSHDSSRAVRTGGAVHQGRSRGLTSRRAKRHDRRPRQSPTLVDRSPHVPHRLPTRTRRMLVAAASRRRPRSRRALPALAGPGSSEPFALSSVGGKGYFWAHEQEPRLRAVAHGRHRRGHEDLPGVPGRCGRRRWRQSGVVVGGRLWVFATTASTARAVPHRSCDRQAEAAQGHRPRARSGAAMTPPADYLFVGDQRQGHLPRRRRDGNGREWWVTTVRRRAPGCSRPRTRTAAGCRSGTPRSAASCCSMRPSGTSQPGPPTAPPPARPRSRTSAVGDQSLPARAAAERRGDHERFHRRDAVAAVRQRRGDRLAASSRSTRPATPSPTASSS